MARPSEFRKKYCDALIKHMEKGLSFESFGGKVGVCKKTLYRWVKHHPEFKRAKALGETRSLLFWENLGIRGAQGEVKGFNVASWIFNCKNRFGWRDNRTADDGHKGGQAPHQAAAPSPVDAQELVELVKQARGKK